MISLATLTAAIRATQARAERERQMVDDLPLDHPLVQRNEALRRVTVRFSQSTARRGTDKLRRAIFGSVRA